MNNKEEVVFVAALAAITCLVSVLLLLGVYALLGLALYVVWEYGVLISWPDLPVVEWWQFSLVAWGLMIVRGLLKCGPSLRS